MLCTVFDSPAQKKHGYNGVSPVKENKDNKGTGSCDVQDAAERTEVVPAGDDKA